jgi:hypothetical protein
LLLFFAQICVKPRKANVSGFPDPHPLSPALCRIIRTEFQQAGFPGIQFQVELPKAFGKFCPEPFGVQLDLKAKYDVIREGHDYDVALRPLVTPCLDPKVKHVVEIDVRQQWRQDAPYAQGNFQSRV